MEILIYLLLGVASFFFVVIPISGSFVLNPLLSLIVNPHAAISIAAFFFLLNSSIKAFVFRHDIRYVYVKRILPLSLIAAALGAWLVAYIPEDILLVIIFVFAIYFLIKTLRDIFTKDEKNNSHNLVTHIMSLLSGFIQGSGVGGGGGLRKLYLLSENLTLSEMHGTTSFIGVWILAASVGVRLGTSQVTYDLLLPILYLVPIMILAIWLGRHFLKKLNKKTTRIITVIVMLVVTIMLGTKMF
jgi:uncharacterized protein